MKRIIYAIDPDVDKSGIAMVNMQARCVHASTMTFPELIKFLTLQVPQHIKEGMIVEVVVECSWDSEHNWHMRTGINHRKAASLGYDEGRNHEVGRKIVEMLEYHQIEVKLRRPLRKIWKGPGGKITHEEMTQICGWVHKRSNQEERDAMLLAWDESGLPMRVKI